MTLERVNEWGEIRSVFIKDRPPVERVSPLNAGSKAPVFSLTETATGWQASDAAGHVPGTLTLPELLAVGPVVVSFYCPCWGSYARPFLTTLTTLSPRIRAAGAQLVVFSNEDPRYLRQDLAGASLLVVHDADYTVARRFGVYSDYDPIWDRVSGISEDVYVPALYVIDQSGRVRYRFLDEQFEGFTQPADVLSALR